MSDSLPEPEVWTRIRPLVHTKATEDADKFLAEMEMAKRNFIGNLDARRTRAGQRSLSELEPLTEAAVELANASRSDGPWATFRREPERHTAYASKVIRGAVRRIGHVDDLRA